MNNVQFNENSNDYDYGKSNESQTHNDVNNLVQYDQYNNVYQPTEENFIQNTQHVYNTQQQIYNTTQNYDPQSYQFQTEPNISLSHYQPSEQIAENHPILTSQTSSLSTTANEQFNSNSEYNHFKESDNTTLESWQSYYIYIYIYVCLCVFNFFYHYCFFNIYYFNK